MTDAEKAYARLGECMKKVFDEIEIQNLTSTDLYLLLGEKIDLINSQKAELERYKGVIKILENDVKTAKADAVKEYMEKVKEVLLGKSIFPVLVKNALDEAEKELVG